MAAPSRRTEAPTGVAPMSREALRRLCLAKGAATEDGRASLAGVHRGTLRRWLKGEVSPLLHVARSVARNLDGTVDELWPEGGEGPR